MQRSGRKMRIKPQYARPHSAQDFSLAASSRMRQAARNILQAGKAILAGADKLREHEKTTVGLTGG